MSFSAAALSRVVVASEPSLRVNFALTELSDEQRTILGQFKPAPRGSHSRMTDD
jgi:hypothetical protein